MLKLAVSLTLVLCGLRAFAAEQNMDFADRLFMNIHTAKQLETAAKVMFGNEEDLAYLHELAGKNPDATVSFSRSGSTAVFSTGADKLTIDVQHARDGIVMANGHKVDALKAASFKDLVEAIQHAMEGKTALRVPPGLLLLQSEDAHAIILPVMIALGGGYAWAKVSNHVGKECLEQGMGQREAALHPGFSEKSVRRICGVMAVMGPLSYAAVPAERTLGVHDTYMTSAQITCQKGKDGTFSLIRTLSDGSKELVTAEFKDGKPMNFDVMRNQEKTRFNVDSNFWVKSRSTFNKAGVEKKSPKHALLAEASFSYGLKVLTQKCEASPGDVAGFQELMNLKSVTVSAPMPGADSAQ
jgi:hypothetical protein